MASESYPAKPEIRPADFNFCAQRCQTKRSDGVLEYWSDGYVARELYTSENPDGLCSKLRKIGVRFCFSNTPTLHKCVEQSGVMKIPLPRGKATPGPSPQTNAGSTMGLDSLLGLFDNGFLIGHIAIDNCFPKKRRPFASVHIDKHHIEHKLQNVICRHFGLRLRQEFLHIDMLSK